MNILITGSNGYIGSNLKIFLQEHHNIYGLNRNICDLTNTYQVQKWFENNFFDIIIHTAIKGGSRLVIDKSDIIDQNLQIYFNLLQCKQHYHKFINIGSGAEICSPFSPYGLSKRVIHESLSDKENFYSLRIFGIFNHNEFDTRFIKSNIKRYINKEKMIIYKDRLMDFIYFNDFVELIKYYIANHNAPKFLDCVYKNKHLLSDICNMINSLSDHRVPVEIQEKDQFDFAYTGVYNDIRLSMCGLEQGILQTYKALLKNYE